MKRSKSTVALLDFLAQETDCAYLSDLRKPNLYPELFEAMEHIEAERYSFMEWKDAIAYITGDEKELTSEQDAREYLLGYLKK